MMTCGARQPSEGVRRPRTLRVARRYSAIVSRHRWWFVLAMLGVTGVAAIPIPDLFRHITMNRGALQNPDDPVRKRFEEVVRRFGTPFFNTVVLEGRDREALHRVADRIAATLSAPEPEDATPADACTDTRFSARQVRDVMYKVDLAEFERRGIYYLSEDDLRKLADALEAASGAESGERGSTPPFPPLTGLQAALDGLADGIEKGEAAPGADDAANAEALGRLSDALRRIMRWMDEPYPDERIAESAAPELSPEDRRGVDERGYLSEGEDPIRVFLFVRPVSDSEDDEVFGCFTRLVRTAVRDAIAAEGGGGPPGSPAATRSIRSWVTGMPALVADDMDVISGDARRVAIISGALILVLLMAYYRSFRTTAALFVPLLVGCVFTLGITGVVIGRLTIISVYFGGILFGLGIDYAIQLLMRYDDEVRSGRVPEEAWAQSLANTGGGILTGAATTAAAFYAVGLTEFEGYAELGIIAGSGVVCIFLATLVILPLLVFMLHRTRPRRLTLAMGMDRVLRTLASRIAVLVVAGCVVAWGVGSAPFRDFDHDPVNLMAQDAESAQGTKVLLQTEFSHETAIATAPSAAEAIEMAHEYERLGRADSDGANGRPRRACLDRPPTIARVESRERFTRFLPKVSDGKARAVIRIAQRDAFLEKLRTEVEQGRRSPEKVEPERVAATLWRIADAAGNLAFDYRSAKPDSPLTGALGRLADTATKLAERVEKAPPAGVRTQLEGFQRWLLGEVSYGLDVVRKGLAFASHPGDVAALPAQVEERFRSRDGKWHAIYVHPTGSVGNWDFLSCFVADLRGVDPGATGFPVTHHTFARMVERSFEAATLYSLAAVVLCLVIHLRSLWQVLTALAPLLIGVSAVVAIHVAAGLRFNFVNVMALPVLLGTGVDYGVYLVHRHRERFDGAGGLAGTATAITLSAVTTIIGFGTLMTSQHHGMWSLGFALVVGIVGCLAAAQLVVSVVLSLAETGGDAGAGATGRLSLPGRGTLARGDTGRRPGGGVSR